MGSKPVEASPEARTEILEASAYYEDAREGLGDDFLDCVQEGFARIAEAPEAQSPAPGVEDVEVRIARIRRFPYHLIFLELPDEIRVVAVAHVRRRPGYWLERIEPQSEE